MHWRQLTAEQEAVRAEPIGETSGSEAHVVIERRFFHSLSGGQRDWLTAKHHFPFGDSDAGWGALRIWNDDEIAPNGGFPPHLHTNMEIITYVRDGALSHRDSLGNHGRIVAGDVQVMSAGTGIRHSEFNFEPQIARIFQIWIKPSVDSGSPAWGTKPFPKKDRAGRLVILASGFESDRWALPIRAEARVLGATLNRDQILTYDTGSDRFLYLVPATGSVNLNDVQVDARDGAAIRGIRRLTITALQDSEFVLVDAPPRRSGLNPATVTVRT
jgi:redox-sensitive bicupin YhaK (pirin superfamily)